MPAEKKPKRRRKNSKYAPLIWIVTGALIAFLISYSGTLKLQLPGFNSKPQVIKPQQASSRASGGGLFGLFGQKSSKSVSRSAQSQALSPASEAAGGKPVSIYVCVQEGNEIILSARQVNTAPGTQPLEGALEALIAYRSETESLNLVPIDARIRKVWIKDEVAYIDWNERFTYNSYGLIGYKLQLYQVVHTACQFSGVRAVYFYLEGKPLKYLGGDGYPVNNPVYPYSSLPRFEIPE